ncbi:MAG TPA: BON domain-containing protein [Flavisolibacter sp.]|nr:BON domain-containing protein [Flavisolibacter sp.]
MNNRNWDNESQSYNSSWDSDRNDDYRNREEYGRNQNTNYGSSYGRNRMNDDDYRQMNSGYDRDENYNRYNERMGGMYNDRLNMDSDRYRNQMQSMSGNRDVESWNDRDRNYGRGGYGSRYNSDYGNRHNMSGGFGDHMDRNYGGGYTGAGGYISNRGNDNRDYDRTGNNSGRDWWDRAKDKVSSWLSDDDERRSSGPHRGKGPKDYQRSEQRIREDVCDRLSDDDRIDASNVQVQIQNNEVILTGTVRSKEEKRRAEDLVESISGVRHVENRLRVSREDGTSLFGGSTGSARITGGDSTGTERASNR